MDSQPITEHTRSSSEAIAHRQTKRRGFNLIEAAIVLGVVGVIIGGIWAAAASFYESYKVNKTVEGVMETSRNIQRIFTVKDFVSIANNTDLTQILSDAKAFPESWNQKSGVFHPYGKDTHIYTRTSGYFLTVLDDIPKKSCVHLVARISAIGRQANSDSGNGDRTRLGLGAVTVNYQANFIATDFPIPIETAITACNLDNNRLDFMFGLTRIN